MVHSTVQIELVCSVGGTSYDNFRNCTLSLPQLCFLEPHYALPATACLLWQKHMQYIGQYTCTPSLPHHHNSLSPSLSSLHPSLTLPQPPSSPALPPSLTTTNSPSLPHHNPPSPSLTTPQPPHPPSLPLSLPHLSTMRFCTISLPR